MRKFIEEYFKSNPKDLTPGEVEKMAEFVSRFMSTDEYYLIETMIKLDYRNKMQECNRSGSKDPTADLYRMAGKQSIIDSLEAICAINKIKQAELKAIKKAKREEKKEQKDNSGYGNEMGTDSEESII